MIMTTPVTHKVVSGDTLFSLSKKYGLTVNELKEFNNLKTDTIKVGQVLKLARLIHTVVSGDTLYSLAKKHNTTVEILQSINGLKDNLIKVGQVLRLPEKYGAYFVLKDESGNLLNNFDYEIELSNGEIYRGVTNIKGETSYIEVNQLLQVVDIRLFAKYKNETFYMLAHNNLNTNTVSDVPNTILPKKQVTISYSKALAKNTVFIPYGMYVNTNANKILLEQQRNNLLFEKNTWNSWDMLQHYRKGNGKSMTLSEMGLLKGVKTLVTMDGAFKKSNNIQERFLTKQVVNQDYTFKQVYSWGDELVWAMGEGVLSGEFKGSVIDKGNGTVLIDGVITYQYADKFTDPYDTFDWVEGETDIGGVAYDITETWTVKVNGIYNKEQK